jgi:two-component system chemotaxis response regulator CheY
MSKHVLIVDDSTSVRQMVEATLKSAGYTVTAAKDGLEAFNLCKTKSYDFVLTDQNMPNMDGLTLINNRSKRCNESAGACSRGNRLDGQAI